MIDKIKNDISEIKNKKVKIKINNIRNKSEVIECYIRELYPRLFVVEDMDGVARSFNYVDILTSNVEIEGKKY